MMQRQSGRAGRVDYARLAGDAESDSPPKDGAALAPKAPQQPAAAAKPEKKPARKAKKPKKKRRKESCSRFLYAVLKEVHPDRGISRKAMQVMDDLVRDLFHRIATEARQAMESTGRSTLTSHDIRTGTMLVLGNTELERHALSQGQKAVTKFSSA